MTHFNELRFSDGAQLDAFGRVRISSPSAIFESALLHDAAPQFWDTSLGAGMTAPHSPDLAAVTLTSTLDTAGTATRQTFQRFHYQPGKSHLILMTGVLQASGGGTNVVRRIGLFDDDNGLFFEDNQGTVRVVRRTSTTGTPSDTAAVNQDSWNLDKMDGTGPSGITVDWSQAQIFVIDFEWLGVGRVRFGLNIDGVTWPVHQMVHANNLATVFMSTPNLPIRYQMVTTAPCAASTLIQVCSAVISEGGSDVLGRTRAITTGSASISLNAGDLYGVLGIRLQSDRSAAIVEITGVSANSPAGDDFEYLLLWNPTFDSALTGWVDASASAVEYAVGSSTTTIDETASMEIIDAGQINGTVGTEFRNPSLRRLGVDIAGTAFDTVVLAIRPLTNGTFRGTIKWREV